MASLIYGGLENCLISIEIECYRMLYVHRLRSQALKWLKIIPGVGFGMVVLSAIFVLHHHLILVWILNYLAVSFTWDLPWTTCNATWNTPNCVLTLGDASVHSNETLLSNITSTYVPSPSNATWLRNVTINYNRTTAAEEFWQWVVTRTTWSESRDPYRYVPFHLIMW